MRILVVGASGYVDRRQRRVQAPAEQTFAQVERLGGNTGWAFGNVLWRLRGLLDRFVGAPGCASAVATRRTSGSVTRSTSDA